MNAVTRSHNGMQVAFLFVGNGISRREKRRGCSVTEDGKSKCMKRNNDDDDDHDGGGT